jgi:hypothetical protein
MLSKRAKARAERAADKEGKAARRYSEPNDKSLKLGRRSGSVEVFFSFDGTERALKRPLFFHHIPKTGGTSFRAMVRNHMMAHRMHYVGLAAAKDAYIAAGKWPHGLIETYNAIRSLGALESFVSHYTAILSDVIAEPILAISREPESQYFSRLNFAATHAQKLPQRLLALGAERLAKAGHNPQTSSLVRLWGIEVPMLKPDDPGELAQGLSLVDRIAQRFTLFQIEHLSDFLAYCGEEYGLSGEMPHKKPTTYSDENRSIADAMGRYLKEHDFLWLDRILYARASRGASDRLSNPPKGLTA